MYNEPTPIDHPASLKKILAIFFILLLALALIWWGWHYLTFGQLDIQAEPSETISLSYRVGKAPKNKSLLIKQSKGHLKISLRGGQYIATVQGNSVASSQIVSVKAHHAAKYELSAPRASGVEPVLDNNVSYVAASSSRLVFLDPTNQQLYEVDSSSNLSPLDTSLRFYGAKWASADYGIGLDTNGKLHYIKDGVVSSFNQDFFGPRIVSYDISPQRRIYISDGKNVYAGKEGGAFKKIHFGWTLGSSLLAGPNGVAIINAADTDDINAEGGTPELTVIDDGGHQASKAIGTFFAAWSPSGKYLAISSSGGGEIVDSSLNEVALIPQNNFDNPIWLNDSSLFYSFNDQLWSYNLAVRKASLVANMPLGGTITDLSLSGDKSYLYIAARSGYSSDSIELKRIGLNGQKNDPLAYQLQDLLPLNVGGCYFGLLNFTSPTVITNPESCLTAGQKLLQQNGINAPKIKLRLSRYLLGAD